MSLIIDIYHKRTNLSDDWMIYKKKKKKKRKSEYLKSLEFYNQGIFIN